MANNSFRFSGRYAMTDIQKKQITEMRTNGMIFANIASELHFSINSIKSFCRQNNIMPLTQNECELKSSSIPQNERCKRCGGEADEHAGSPSKDLLHPCLSATILAGASGAYESYRHHSETLSRLWEGILRLSGSQPEILLSRLLYRVPLQEGCCA